MISRKWRLSRLQIYYTVPLYSHIQISLLRVSGAAILLNPTKGTYHFCMYLNKLSRGPLSAYFHTSNPEELIAFVPGAGEMGVSQAN